MSIALQTLKSPITYWPVTGSDTFGGFTFGTPLVLYGRWEDKQELFVDAEGEEVLSQAIVYLKDNIAPGDYLAEGDQTSTPSPDTLPGAHRVRNYSRVTDLHSLNALRKAWL